MKPEPGLHRSIFIFSMRLPWSVNLAIKTANVRKFQLCRLQDICFTPHDGLKSLSYYPLACLGLMGLEYSVWMEVDQEDWYWQW